jgi:hypothetical protein
MERYGPLTKGVNAYRADGPLHSESVRPQAPSSLPSNPGPRSPIGTSLRTTRRRARESNGIHRVPAPPFVKRHRAGRRPGPRAARRGHRKRAAEGHDTRSPGEPIPPFHVSRRCHSCRALDRGPLFGRGRRTPKFERRADDGGRRVCILHAPFDHPRIGPTAIQQKKEEKRPAGTSDHRGLGMVARSGPAAQRRGACGTGRAHLNESKKS